MQASHLASFSGVWLTKWRRPFGLAYKVCLAASWAILGRTKFVLQFEQLVGRLAYKVCLPDVWAILGRTKFTSLQCGQSYKLGGRPFGRAYKVFLAAVWTSSRAAGVQSLPPCSFGIPFAYKVCLPAVWVSSRAAGVQSLLSCSLGNPLASKCCLLAIWSPLWAAGVKSVWAILDVQRDPPCSLGNPWAYTSVTMFQSSCCYIELCCVVNTNHKYV